MPELPEVEVVRRGLERWVAGRTVARAEVLHPRAVRRHVPGAEEFAARLAGRTIGSAERRGKYLWLPLDGSDAILAHLGMSGQLLVVEPDAAPERHLRIRLGFADGGPELRFVDQRTFGHVLVAPMTLRLPRWVPEPIAHIAADPFEAEFDDELFTIDLRRRRTEVKRALLDQSLISGVGNIYADEALWRARLHGTRPADTLTRPKIAELLAAAREVMSEALAEGGTSFDSLYVNVNGESGYFERSLAVYGRRGLPCRRCGAPIVRESFMNRSSYSCPRCQPPPRRSRKMGA
ncbi:bifunctional DNA-formamidopyrimidine glycosylase/DNA-(apurinic or apyrimidinic site) lyase [Planomonospora sp. ID91781]|uniref:bifunctional DNA-formamidopyrimidine glycosylase/DNA-(apurinic or apyrimidinic site) lyase n=1 Tax=Planomonospora sp. ID91781 TaxID=2738135 RepID=UPI0018C3B7B3|nr:bifunctional DNA-formamidopyrimidine glycosylase/DNA-(apurinic or apyrimidinic site) lyase [Planomonospora sp. ID91781]MBG0825303.1 bifunctional DNA-formamidopyrimidine glycosylase/DNA-(apurinic or apyrimidinic site) lyase [Planomonospora sp. ID91781]